MTAPAGSRRAVLDLRQYTTVPGARDALIDLFDEHFVTGQEAHGMHVVGQFRDLDDPDRFVWLRGFDSMPARGEACREFYSGPVWREHREATNATLIDSDNALLLRPVQFGAAYPDVDLRPAAQTAESGPPSVVGITVLFNDRPVEQPLIDAVLAGAVPAMARAGGEPVAVLVTDPSENNFPALPLRIENVVVWIMRFADDEAWHLHRDALVASSAWQDEVLPVLMATASQPLQELRLRPTAGSQLR